MDQRDRDIQQGRASYDQMLAQLRQHIRDLGPEDQDNLFKLLTKRAGRYRPNNPERVLHELAIVGMVNLWDIGGETFAVGDQEGGTK